MRKVKGSIFNMLVYSVVIWEVEIQRIMNKLDFQYMLSSHLDVTTPLACPIFSFFVRVIFLWVQAKYFRVSLSDDFGYKILPVLSEEGCVC